MFASGLSSGIDTRSLVRQLVQIERQPLARLEAKGRAVDKQISRLGDFSTKLAALGETLAALGETSGLLATEASSSDEDALGVAAAGDASQGSWEVEVDARARRAVERSTAHAGAGAEIRAGTLTITAQQGDPFTIEIEPGATLGQVRDQVRALGAPVDVSIVHADAGAFLSITARDPGHPDSGEEDALVIEESYTGGSGAALGMSRAQTAERASLRVDGLAITRDSNEIDDVIDGVTLSLGEPGSGPVRVEVEADQDASIENVRGVVDDLNDLLKAADALAEEDARFGRQAKAALRDALGGARGEKGSTLSRIGVRTDPDNGRLRLDEAALRDALADDSSEVASVFGAQEGGAIGRLVGVIDRYTDPFSGSIDAAKDALATRRASIDQRVERGDARLEAFEKRMTAQFSAMEQLISEMNERSTQIASYLPGLYAGT